LHNKVEVAVFDWLKVQAPNFYRDRAFKLVPDWTCASAWMETGDCVERNGA